MIKTIINEWDPIDLFPYAPEDEYEEEIRLLDDFIRVNDPNTEMLTNEIHRVFQKRFGADVFKLNKSECNDIAEKILKHLAT